MAKVGIGLWLLFAYAASFAVAAWTAEEPDDGPGAFAVMVFGFVLLGTYLVARLITWLASRDGAEPHGFPVKINQKHPS